MIDRKLLTIAIPTYNGSKTIKSMLDVLLPQVDNRVEIIISDNCSNDTTQDIVTEYLKRFPFIKYVRNSHNIGADRNFLQCMQLASGKYTMLLSDDDVLIENALCRILNFLETNYDVSLVFLYTVSFKDKYIDLNHCDAFKEGLLIPCTDIVTTDKKKFISYVGRQWGFTSSFLWNTERFKDIVNVERFFDSFWLQSYVHILCSNRETDRLGVVSTPCIAAGGYGIIPNYDAYYVEVKSFKEMLDFAVKEAKYNEEQLINLWLWKICYVLKRTIIKERAVGKNMTSVGKLFIALKKYPYAWLHLFPYLLLPQFLCKIILKLTRIKQKRNFTSYVNRETKNEPFE